jgi:hypothetical protein
MVKNIEINKTILGREYKKKKKKKKSGTTIIIENIITNDTYYTPILLR